MPHGQDVKDESTETATYECMLCGTIVEDRVHPGECECGGEYQNRANSLE